MSRPKLGYTIQTGINKIIELLSGNAPEVPTEDGEYLLKATISDGDATYEWSEDEIPEVTDADEHKVMTVVPSTDDTPAKWSAVMPAETAHISGNENLFYNTVPLEYFSSDSVGIDLKDWKYARGVTAIDFYSIPGKYFNFHFGTGIASNKVTGQLQKYYRDAGNLIYGRGEEIGKLKSGDKITVSFEVKSSVSLEYLRCAFSGTVTSGTAPTPSRVIDLEDVSANDWTLIKGSGTVPEWWSSFKDSATAKAVIMNITFKLGSGYTGSDEADLFFRNIKVEYGDTATDYRPAEYDITRISANTCNHLSNIPEVPTIDGTYNLQASVSSGEASYSWVNGGGASSGFIAYDSSTSILDASYNDLSALLSAGVVPWTIVPWENTSGPNLIVRLDMLAPAPSYYAEFSATYLDIDGHIKHTIYSFTASQDTDDFALDSASSAIHTSIN